MDMMTGTCKFCGQVKSVEASGAAHADRVATSQCDCPDAKLMRRREAAVEAMAAMCEAPESETGFAALPFNTVCMLKDLAYHMMDNGINKVALTMKDRGIVLATEDDGLIFKQTRKIESGGKC